MTAQMVMAMMSSRLCLRVRSWRGSSREAKCVASERSFRADMANLRARMSKNTEVGWPGWDQPSSHCPQTTYFDAIALRLLVLFIRVVFGVIELRWWEGVVYIVVVVQGQADLLEVILASSARGALADALDGGKQQG